MDLSFKSHVYHIHMVIFSESPATEIQDPDHPDTAEISQDNNSNQTTDNIPGNLSFIIKMANTVKIWLITVQWMVDLSFKSHFYHIHMVIFSESPATEIQDPDHPHTAEISQDNNSNQTTDIMPGNVSFIRKMANTVKIWLITCLILALNITFLTPMLVYFYLSSETN